MCAHVCVCISCFQSNTWVNFGFVSTFIFLSVAEDKMGWHGKPLPRDMADSVVKELQGRIVSCNKRIYPSPPKEDTSPVSLRNFRMPSAPSYKPGEKV